MPKVTRHGGPSNRALPPADGTEREHPGTGAPMEPVEAKADGSVTELSAESEAPRPRKRTPRKSTPRKVSGG